MDGTGYRDYDNGPAKIWYNEDGSVKREEWCQRDILHREGGPALITYKHGSVYSECWYKQGIRHHIGGPAGTLYWDNGNVSEQVWYEYGRQQCRDGGPAAIFYDEDGNVLREVYYYDNVLHRDNGPAIIDCYGMCSYWWHGEKVSQEEYMEKYYIPYRVECVKQLQCNLINLI